MDFEVAKIGERGQLVIPQPFRKSMSLHKGDKFAVIERGDMMIFKKLESPSFKEFDLMIKKGHAHAKKHKLEKVYVP